MNERGTTSILALGVLLGAVLLISLLAGVGGTYVAHAELQQAADIAAASLADGVGDDSDAHARLLARRNGARRVRIEVDGAHATVRVTRRIRVPITGSGWATIHAESSVDLVRAAVTGDAGPNPPGQYDGVLEVVDGVRVCPRVAGAYRRMDAAAARDGITLTPTSGFRTYAEQAVLFARLGPRLAAAPGTSRHHDATELDINVGPAGSATHNWLRSRAPAFGFVQRYSWEPWHWGYVTGC